MIVDFTEDVTLPGFVSFSSSSLFGKCHQAWHYRYLRHLDQAESKPPTKRDFGSWWHALRAADAITRGDQIGSLVHHQDRIETTDDGPTIPVRLGPGETPLVEAVLAAATRWWGDQTEDYKAAFTEALREPLVPRLQHLDRAYRETYADSIGSEHPVAVEVPLELPLRFDGGTTTRFIGFIDEIYRDTRRGFLVVRDHKTHDNLDGFTSETDLMDSQLHLYAWAAGRCFDDLNGQIKAVVYDRVRSIAPREPKLTLTGTLSKSVTDYDLDTYRRWAAGPDGKGVPFEGRKKDGSGAGVYVGEEKILAALDAPEARAKWCRKNLTPLNRKVVQAHVQMLADRVREMPGVVARINSTHAASRSMSRSACMYCPYADLCRAQMLGGAGRDDVTYFGVTQTAEVEK